MLTSEGFANSENSESDSEEDKSAEESENKRKKSTSVVKTGVYVPPKIKPVYYDGDSKPEDREKNILERAKRRAITYETFLRSL